MEKRLLVADAGPLIALAKIGQLRLLYDLFPSVVITESVRAECLKKETEDAEFIREATEAWLACVPDPEPVIKLMRGLGSGECHSIQFALHDPDSRLLLLDDALARKEAGRKGLRFIGTAMMLCLAEEKGLLKSAERMAEKMAAVGYRISPQIFKLIRDSKNPKQKSG